jgi:hypothetical protein
MAASSGSDDDDDDDEEEEEHEEEDEVDDDTEINGLSTPQAKRRAQTEGLELEPSDRTDSGFKGVYQHAGGRWYAKNGPPDYERLGSGFASAEGAALARVRAMEKLEKQPVTPVVQRLPGEDPLTRVLDEVNEKEPATAASLRSANEVVQQEIDADTQHAAAERRLLVQLAETKQARADCKRRRATAEKAAREKQEEHDEVLNKKRKVTDALAARARAAELEKAALE